ncbi:MAG: imidazole glycerol phosphate synthase subunit HisH [Candidatus Omnitrophica bacterium]|nr:imidazole glycerol phosphate synthase subunit HisH [Candidatus Omnitrophota bacterium]MBU0878391.1 imidazole glycerol phosphate synthase subunit HisH [Candidatus Omnitrophota bacterium]MBU0897352.1 imidazole glycerol phosphate synthase subunit HisH [Candidatus Omnitrophota bacterium]MBU1134007.1 imidazole glycerol phosphate synthase subunit HisH [Candidatus Omnitrophota bacterium]MBU1524081.1 imidazole glycerol phosphate synthase subunit HisH [Candidatus Omnitrophota bacterium]
MIAVIDYGMGNLRSVAKALEAVGAETKVTSNAKDIGEASAIVLPGVGAFARGIENLEKLDVLPAMFKAIGEGKPFLGICLGLQLLFTESQEHGIYKGLDIIQGKVKRFRIQDSGFRIHDSRLKIPHMGWNTVECKMQNAKCKIFENIPDNSYFYFVHSYYVEPRDKDVVVATTEYGTEFTSAVNKDNIWGVQFHPEKSGELGLKILENFVKSVIRI